MQYLIYSVLKFWHVFNIVNLLNNNNKIYYYYGDDDIVFIVAVIIMVIIMLVEVLMLMEMCIYNVNFKYGICLNSFLVLFTKQ